MGFSTTGAHLVVFLAFLLAASTFVGAYDASVDRVMEGASRSYADRMEQAGTAIEINASVYDNTTNTVSFNVTNTGDRTLSVNRTDVLVDNQYHSLAELDRREVEGDGSERLWLPGENLTVELTIAPAPHRIQVTTEHGVSDLHVTRDDPFVTETDPLWSSFSKNPRNNALTNDSAPITAPEARWNYSAGKRVRGSPAVIARSTTDAPERRTRTTVFVGSDDNFLYALDGDDGFLYWRYDVGGAVTDAVAIHEGTVVVLNENGTAVGLNQKTGAALWTTPIPDTPNLNVPPTTLGDRVYVADDSGDLTAIYLENGTVDWSNTYGSGTAGPIAAADGTVFVPDTGSDLIAIDAEDGSVEWRETYSRPPGGGVAVRDGVIYVGSDKDLHAIYTNGTRVWDVSPGGDYSNTPVVTEETVFVADTKGTMAAFWIANGSTRWEHTSPSNTRIEMSASVAESSVYFGDDNGVLTALWANNGTVRWTHDIATGNLRSSPAIVEGRIYLGTDDAVIHAFE